MITPALDMQAAPQIVDGVRPQAAQPGASGGAGEFGAAFSASLSSSSSSASVADASDSGTAGTQRSSQQKAVNVRSSSDRSAPAQKSSVSSNGTATNLKLPANTSALTSAGVTDSSVDALREALAAVKTKTSAALTESVASKAAKEAANASSEFAQAAASDSQLVPKTDSAASAGKASLIAADHLAELQASLHGLSRSLSAEGAQAPKASTSSNVDEVAGKSRAVTHGSQAAAGNVTGEVLLASLGTAAPVLAGSCVVTTAASPTAMLVEAVKQPQSELPSGQQNGSSGLNVTGAPAGKSNLAAAWNKVGIEAYSGINATSTPLSSGSARSELVHAVGVYGSSLAAATGSGRGIGLVSTDRLPTPPIHLSTSPVVVESSEAVASGSLSLAAITGPVLQTNALSAALSPVSAVNPAGPNTSTATDTLASSLPAKPQSAIADSVASRSSNPSGQAKGATAGVFATAIQAANGASLTESTRASGVATISGSEVASETKPASIGNQQRQGALFPVATTSGAVATKQPAERISSARPSLAAPVTQAAASSHRGSLDTSAITSDRGPGNEAVSNITSTHGDSSAAVPSHAATAPALELSNSSIASTPNLAATMAHQVPASAIDSSPSSAVGAVGSAAPQVAGPEALHGANGLNSVISSEPHQTLAATPTSLEVGVHSGTQGWLKIRAEVGDQGDVTATLASASTSGQQSLKGQLPALNAYLRSEQMAVTTSVAERLGATHVAGAHEALLGSSSAGTGSAQQDASLLQRGAGHGTFSQSGGQQGGEVKSRLTVGDTGREEAPQTYASRVESSSSALPSTAVEGSGRWLNVRV